MSDNDRVNEAVSSDTGGDEYSFTITEFFEDGRLMIFAYRRVGRKYVATMIVSSNDTLKEFVGRMYVEGLLAEK